MGSGLKFGKGCASGRRRRREAVETRGCQWFGCATLLGCGVVPASGVANGNADILAQCASTTPACGLGTSTCGLDSTLLPEKGCHLGWAISQQVVAVDSLLIQETAVGSITPSCLVAHGAKESGPADASVGAGPMDHHADTDSPCTLVWSACGWDQTMVSKTYCELGRVARQEVVYVHRPLQQVAATDLAPAFGFSALTFGLNSTVVSTADWDLGGKQLREVSTAEWSWIHVTATSWSTPSCALADGVIQGGCKDGSDDALAPGVSTIPPCGLFAPTPGLDGAVVSETCCRASRTTFQAVLAVERPFNLAPTTNLRTPSCSLAKGVTETDATLGSTDSLANCVRTSHRFSLAALSFCSQ